MNIRPYRVQQRGKFAMAGAAAISFSVIGAVSFRTIGAVPPVSGNRVTRPATVHAGHLFATKVSAHPTRFPKNSRGETYGSLSKASPRDVPYLIEVIASNGQVGYVQRSAFDAATGANVSSPQQAVTWDEQAANGDLSIPVYAQDGTTVIGSFIITSARGTSITSP